MDFSSKSMKICQERAKVRKLKNILFISDWIENLKKIGLYNVDYIQSSGVLHHLKRPNYGLKIFKDILRAMGGSNLMVYGSTGRLPIYHTKTILALIQPNTFSFKKELICAKHILSIMPYSNWLNKMFVDAHGDNENELYDRYLHKRDISFSSNQVVDFVSESGMHFIDYTPNIYEHHGLFSFDSTLIDVKSYTRQDDGKRYHIKEILISNLIQHNFYISNVIDSQASLSDTENIIYIHGNPIGFRETMIRTPKLSKQLTFWFSHFNAPSSLNVDSHKYTSMDLEKNGIAFRSMSIPYNDLGLKMLFHLLRSTQSMYNGYTMKEMYDFSLAHSNNSDSLHDMISQFSEFLKPFQRIGVVMVRAKHIQRHSSSNMFSYYRFKPKPK